MVDANIFAMIITDERAAVADLDTNSTLMIAHVKLWIHVLGIMVDAPSDVTILLEEQSAVAHMDTS